MGAPPSGRGSSDRFLLEGEVVQYETHRHWAILLRPAGWAAVSLLSLSIFFGMTGSTEVTGLAGLGVMYLWLRLSWRIVDWRYDRLYVTDWRVFSVSGLVTRRLAAMPLRKITDLTYETPPLGRVLGYGRFVLETAGQDQALSRLDFVPRPQHMYEVLSHLTLHGTSPPTDPTSPQSPPPPLAAGTARHSPTGRPDWRHRLFGGDYED
ncbi:MAG: PH domain-containing protein [Acidimicrobiales bacterium]|nr:PH domain-containing protein [Acidimicrobiales bacterium]MCB9372349.1 PH domain-containing protein [Microthrixaceae bacterium]